jgi:serine/threonine-protein kinase BUR1
MPITSLREIRILKSLDHPNVVPVVDIAIEQGKRINSGVLVEWPLLTRLPWTFVLTGSTFEFKPSKTFMVFPYMDHDLAGLLENSSVKLTESQIKQYAIQLLEGTAYMHRVSAWLIPRASLRRLLSPTHPAHDSFHDRMASSIVT